MRWPQEYKFWLWLLHEVIVRVDPDRRVDPDSPWINPQEKKEKPHWISSTTNAKRRAAAAHVEISVWKKKSIELKKRKRRPRQLHLTAPPRGKLIISARPCWRGLGSAGWVKARGALGWLLSSASAGKAAHKAQEIECRMCGNPTFPSCDGNWVVLIKTNFLLRRETVKSYFLGNFTSFLHTSFLLVTTRKEEENPMQTC